MMKLNLGIIHKNGQVINHRSIIKILLNPFLRYLFGIQIVSYMDIGLTKVISVGIQRSINRTFDFHESWYYNADQCIVEKKRIWI